MRSYGTLSFIPDGTPRALWKLEATPDVMMKIKRIFARVETYARAHVTLEHTDEVARELMWFMDRHPLSMSDDDWQRLQDAAARHRQREETVMAILAGEGVHFEGQMTPAREPREYQRIAADLAIANQSLLLADDLGLGKSMSALLTLGDPQSLPALIVCPTHLPRQWQRELNATFPLLRSHIIRTGRPYEISKRREMKGHDPDVLIINYHKLRGWVDHLAGRVRTVIFDECQELRRDDSEKYKAAKRIADGAYLRMGLSATPVFNYGGEIYNVLSPLAPDALGSRDEFAREWGATRYWQEKMRVSDPRALGTYLRGEGLMLRRTRADVGRELPEVVRVPHTVDSDRETHDQLMEGAVDLAELILSGDRKQAFVAAGDFDWQMRHATGVAKAPYVAEFVRMLLESEEKVVLFGWHHDVYDVWMEKLAEFNPVRYTGQESPAQKADAVERFLAPPRFEDQYYRDETECRVLIISLRAGAGLDGLQEASHVAVFGELDWSPAMHDQCIGRLHRDGQDDPVVAYFLVSDVGSDPEMAGVLDLKRRQGEPIRDPDAPLFEATGDPRDRIKHLAESVLRKRGQGTERAA